MARFCSNLFKSKSCQIAKLASRPFAGAASRPAFLGDCPHCKGDCPIVCLIGVALPGGRTPDEEIQRAVAEYFDKIVLPGARKIIATQLKIILKGGIL